jgi:hypothetical protein
MPVRRVKGSLFRQTAVMGISYMVRGGTEAECQRELDRLCRLLGAVPTTRPSDALGRGWVARAVPTPKAPADGEGLAVER